MTTFVFTIRRDDIDSPSGASKKQFEKDLVTNFKSIDYMQGYAQGYGFGKIKILTLDEFQKIHNSVTSINNYAYFVYVKDNYYNNEYDD